MTKKLKCNFLFFDDDYLFWFRLFGIDKAFNFVCLEGDYEKEVKSLETDEMELETAESSNLQTESISDFLKNYQSHIKKM